MQGVTYTGQRGVGSQKLGESPVPQAMGAPPAADDAGDYLADDTDAYLTGE